MSLHTHLFHLKLLLAQLVSASHSSNNGFIITEISLSTNPEAGIHVVSTRVMPSDSEKTRSRLMDSKPAAWQPLNDNEHVKSFLLSPTIDVVGAPVVAG